MTDWRENQKFYEKKYGVYPPPPPPGKRGNAE